MLGPQLFNVNATTTEAAAQLAPGEGDEFLDRIRNCADRDEAVVKVLKELGTSRNLRGEEWSEENGLILYHNKVYIPLDPSCDMTLSRHTMIHFSLVTLDAGELLNSFHEAIGGLEWVVTLPNM